MPLLYSLAWFLSVILLAVIACGLFLLAVFLLAFAWRAPRRHKSMSLGYCLMHTLCWLILKCGYRIRVRGLENIPEEGGVLLIANHVAYADVLVMGVMLRRPVRFLSWEGFERHKFLGFMCRLMGTIPVSETKAKEAIVKSARRHSRTRWPRT